MEHNFIVRFITEERAGERDIGQDVLQINRNIALHTKMVDERMEFRNSLRTENPNLTDAKMLLKIFFFNSDD